MNEPRSTTMSASEASAPIRVLRSLGVDRPIIHTLMGHGWTVLTGPVTVLMIATFLSAELQGYFFTFLSLTALNVFFELGLSYVLMQVASHESASLTWTPEGTVTGDAKGVARMAALFHRSVQWYATAAVLMALLLTPAGAVFFARSHPSAAGVSWQFPWALAVLSVALNLCITPFLAVLEGSGQVAQVTFVRAVGNIVRNVAFWLALALHFQLFSAFVLNAAMFAWCLGWILANRRRFFSNLWSRRTLPHDFDWRREVWPFQWKIAVSWLSGYFLFQLFTPILFAFQGPVVAGKMGMSIAITNTIRTAGMAWIETKGAPFGRLIARREFGELDRLFFRTMLQSFGVVALGQALFWAAVHVLRTIGHPLAERVLAPLPLAFLAGTAIVNQVIFSQALYLRAHKQEPLLWPSVVGAVITAVATYVLGRGYGATGMMIGNFVLTLPGIGLVTWIFLTKRRLWHSEP